jgi:hypothetical protein
MHKVIALILAGAVFLGLANAQAQSFPGMRIRGAITGFDGHALQVKTRDGTDLTISVTDNTKINALVTRKMSDIKPGSFVGVTAIRKTPRAPLLAREVHIFAEAQRGTGEGHYAWDSEPGSSMTNANVDAIVDTINGKELTLGYKDGRQKIIVPRGVPVVSFQPADQSRLKKGVQIFCITLQADDGSVKARYITVANKGLKPPM